jgi:hypothetical protein
MSELFHPPLSKKAMLELHQFQILRADLQISETVDTWIYFGGATQFNVSNAYPLQMGNMEVPKALK